MDIEQLKLVLEAVGTATNGAMWVVVLWIAKDLLIGVIVASVFFWLISKAAALSGDAIRSTSLAHRMKSEHPRLNNNGSDYFFPSDAVVILETYRRGLEVEANK